MKNKISHFNKISRSNKNSRPDKNSASPYTMPFAIQPAALLKGLAAAVIFSAFASLLLAAACCFTDLAAPTAHLLQFAVLGSASLVGGFVTARSSTAKSLQHTLLLALLISLLLLAFTLTTGDITQAAVLIKTPLIFLAAALGSVLAVLF